MFKKENLKNIRVIDIHSHILPGIDDGSKSIEESVLMAKQALNSGVTDIICTPHFKIESNITSLEKINELIALLQKELKNNDIDIKLYPGNEVLRHRINNISFTGLNGTNTVLLEFYPEDDFSFIVNTVIDYEAKGYKVIIAHIERYECLLNNFKNVETLLDLDVLIQINYLSVTGRYGLKVKHFVKKLLNRQYVDFISSDAHNTETRNYELSDIIKYLYSKYDEEYIDDILYRNAENYLDIR